MGTIWYRGSRWAEKPQPKEFAKETEKCLISANGRRTRKVGADESWYQTAAEAQARIDSERKYRKECKQKDAMRSAGPELHYALLRLLRELPERRDWLDPETEKIAREALKKAEGN